MEALVCNAMGRLCSLPPVIHSTFLLLVLGLLKNQSHSLSLPVSKLDR